MGLTSELLVRITADGKGVKPGLDDAAKYFKRFNDESLGKVSKTIGMLSPALGGMFERASGALGKFTGALGSSAGRWMLMAAPLLAIPGAFALALRHAKEISATAKQIDVSIPEASRLLRAGSMSGIDVGALGERLRESRSKALQGSKEELDAFSRIGITLRDIERMNAGELLQKMADAVASGALNSANFASGLKLLGDNAKDAIPKLGKFHDELSRQGLTDPGTASSANAVTHFDRAAKRTGADLEFGSKGFLLNFAGFMMNLLAYTGGNAIYSTAKLGKMLPFKRKDPYFDDLEAFGVELSGSGLSEYYRASNTDQLEILSKRLEDRQAVKALRAEQRRAANNAFIDDLYARMYESGSPAAAGAGGGSGSTSKAGGASGAFGFATLTPTSDMARVGLYSATGSMLNQQLQTERDALSELRLIKQRLVSLGIEFNKDH